MNKDPIIRTLENADYFIRLRRALDQIDGDSNIVNALDQIAHAMHLLVEQLEDDR